MIRVLLVDDHPVVRAGYKRLLEYDSNIEVAAEASDAESAYMAFVVYHPDVTVLDLSMPGVSGLSLLQKMLMRDPNAKVLICSMYDSHTIRQKAFQAGAKAFVSKNVAPEKLLLSIHAAYVGEEFVDTDAHSSLSQSDTDEESDDTILCMRKVANQLLQKKEETIALHLTPMGNIHNIKSLGSFTR